MLTRLRQSRLFRRAIRRVGVHRTAKVVGLLQLPFVRALGAVLAPIPRDRRLVVFGAPLDRFADNAAYAFLHMSDHERRDFDPVWITGSSALVARLRARGYRAELRWSWPGVRDCVRAGSYVYSGYRSDINQWLNAGATAVSLWHGLPIKRIEADVAPARERHGAITRLLEAGRDAPPDYLLSSSEFVTRECFARAFRISPERCWELGYPRNDHLLVQPDKPHPAMVAGAGEWERIREAGTVVGLFLTWRDDRSDDAVDEALLQRIASTCAEHGALLAYKAHYNVAPAAIPAESCVLLPSEGDLHAYLGLCEVLITDYSSVALDFLLLGRPTVYYVPDLDHYAATRGFCIHPSTLPGTMARTRDELLQQLSNVLVAPPPAPHGPAATALRERIWNGYDGHASADLAAALRRHVHGRGEA